MISPSASDPSLVPAVLIEDVSVRYQVAHERAGSLKEHLLRRRRADRPPIEYEALRGVSLAVPAGEALGVIGSNGSGKTTLLRVMARVLRPHGGRVRVRGRVAPILDLAGGFIPS